MAKVSLGTGDTNPTKAKRQQVRSSDGTPYVVSISGGLIRIHKGNNTTTPTSFAIQDSGNAPNNSDFKEPAIAIDSADIIHVVWYNNDSAAMGSDEEIQQQTFSTITDLWIGSPEQVANLVNSDGGFSVLENIAIAIDVNDIPHVAYTDNGKDMGSDVTKVFYANRIGGVWNAKVEVFKEPALLSLNPLLLIGQPTSAIGADRPIIMIRHALNSGEIDAYHGNALNAISFVSSLNITGADTADATNMSMIILTSGQITVAYGLSQVFKVVEHNAGDVWGTWQTPVLVYNATVASEFGLSAVALDRFLIGRTNGGSGFMRMFESIGGGAWAEATDSDLPDLTGSFNLGMKWARYNDNPPSTGNSVDYIFKQASTMFWNDFATAAPPAGADEEFAEVIA